MIDSKGATVPQPSKHQKAAGCVFARVVHWNHRNMRQNVRSLKQRNRLFMMDEEGRLFTFPYGSTWAQLKAWTLAGHVFIRVDGIH